MQRLFLKAYNQMMQGREQVIQDCELMRKSLMDFKSTDTDIERQREETQVVAEMIKAAVKDNASTPQSQEEYQKKYEALTQRYETAAAELERLQASHPANPAGQSNGKLHPHTEEAAGAAYRVG